MALLNWSNAFSQAGGALAKVGFEGVKATLEQDKIKLADQLAGTRELARDTRQEGYKIAGEQRGVAIRKEERDAVHRETIDRAPELLGVEVAKRQKIMELEQAFATDSKNVRARAEAEALTKEIAAERGAALQSRLVNTPGYLENLEKLTLAQNPEKRAQIRASAAAAAVNELKLETDKAIKVARGELAAATTPEAKAAAKQKIEGLEWSVAGDRAQTTADAAVLRTLADTANKARDDAKDATDPAVAKRYQAVADRAQATYDSMVVEYRERRGQASGAAPAGRTGWDPATGDVWKDGVNIGKAKDAREASGKIHAPAPSKPAASPTSGILSTPRNDVLAAGASYEATSPELKTLGNRIRILRDSRGGGAGSEMVEATREYAALLARLRGRGEE